MKFSEDILKAFDIEQEDEKHPVNVMKVSEMLSFLKTCGNSDGLY